MAAWLILLCLGFCVCANHVTASRKTTSNRNGHLTGSGFSWCPLIGNRTVSYDPSHEFGPTNWQRIWSCCGGSHQSPIDIRLSKVLPRCFRRLQFRSKGPYQSTMENTGGSVTWQGLRGITQARNVPRMGRDSFTLFQIHIHWGNNGTQSAEHRIDGSGYTAEIHLVFYNRKYGRFSAAQRHRDGLVAVAVFMQEGPMTTNVALKRMLDQLKQVKHPGQEVQVRFRPLALLPRQLDYVTYVGSLTTPPCSENVRWVILMSPHIASHGQVAQLREIIGSQGVPISHHGNRRPVQPLNGRLVERNA